MERHVLFCNVEDWNTTVCLYSVSESSVSAAGAADRGGAARHGTTPDGLEVPSRGTVKDVWMASVLTPFCKCVHIDVFFEW